MNLESLVKEASDKSHEFAFKYNYWVNTRKKTPNLEWLIPLLEKALGKEYVLEAAHTYIKDNNLEENLYGSNSEDN
jgi:hypothetical protein